MTSLLENVTSLMSSLLKNVDNKLDDKLAEKCVYKHVHKNNSSLLSAYDRQQEVLNI